MKKEMFLKIGKYGRPVFWSYLMVISSYFIIIFTKRNIFDGLFELKYIFVDILTYTLLLMVFIFSFYNVTHPYINKDSNDENDSHWATGLCILMPIIIIELLLIRFFNFDLIGYIFKLLNHYN